MIDKPGGAGAIPLPLPAASRVMNAVAGRLMGWSLRETSGAARAVVELYTGGDANGTLIVTISLSAGESTRDYFAGAIYCTSGIFYNLISGAVAGSIWYDPLGPQAPLG